MDFLNELLDLLVEMTLALTEAFAVVLQRAAVSVSQLSPDQAQMCASLVLLGIVGAWFIRKVNWFNPKMFAPQTVTLRTDKTPVQVMLEDLKGCLVSLVILVILMAVLYAVLKGM